MIVKLLSKQTQNKAVVAAVYYTTTIRQSSFCNVSRLALQTFFPATYLAFHSARSPVLSASIVVGNYCKFVVHADAN
jgi:hypothetical protein